MSSQELAQWLKKFVREGGRLQITCNGMSVLASNKLGHHHFSLVGRTDKEVNDLIDTIIPYL